MSMMAKFEELAAQYLRLSLHGIGEGEAIPESAARGQMESALELYLPLMLRGADANHWRFEAFDGFQFPVARKTGPLEAEFRGAGLLLSDQTWTPVQVRIRAAAESDTIAWGQCQVGDRLVGKAERPPHDSSKLGKLLATVCEHPDTVEWAFAVEFPDAAAES